ncbi:peptidoglycan DD-metalloendopeptidase family protein, partial [Coprobacter sp.]
LAGMEVEYGYDPNGNLIQNSDNRISMATYNLLNLPETVVFSDKSISVFSYMADGRKVRNASGSYTLSAAVPIDSVIKNTDPHISYMTEWNDDYRYQAKQQKYINTPEGNIEVSTGRKMSYKYYYTSKDHLGSVWHYWNSLSSKYSNVFYPSGIMREKRRSPYNYALTGKEIVYDNELDEYFFGARTMFAPINRFNQPDPLCEEFYHISPYAYCGNNPVNFIDPDGKREWPVNPTYNGYGRRHENNFGAPRPNGRTHKGIDINHTGGGNTDKGAPIIATHDGTITKIVSIRGGDKDSGGNRVQITSFDGRVSTYYMHLDAISASIETGSSVTEGQQIGTMGGSGKGKPDAYTSHLHYEIKIDGVAVNPVTSATNLLDPQQLITPLTLNGGTLPEVLVIAPKPVQIVPVLEIKPLPIQLPYKLKIQ